MAQLNFDASQVSPQETFEPIPAGWYNAIIDESDLKPTKDGAGAFLHIRFNIVDGQYVGRKVFTRLNIRNANPVAQEIAYKNLSAICHSVGLIQVADSTQLHGRPMKIRVKVRAATGEYEASNEISGYKNVNEATDNTMAPASAAPWGAVPPQAPAQHAAPAAQTQPPMQQAAPQQQWQPPAAAQPWQAPPAPPAQVAQQMNQNMQQMQGQPAWAQAPQQNQPPMQQAPQAAPAQPAEQHPAQVATPPWMQQVQQPASNGTPPWQQ